jgi:hypothetical protein
MFCPSQAINKQIRPDWQVICEPLTRPITRLQLKMYHGEHNKGLVKKLNNKFQYKVCQQVRVKMYRILTFAN